MKLLLLLLFSLITFAQEQKIYGLWYNADGEFVKIFQNNTFNRFTLEDNTRKKITVSTGTIEYVNKELRIVRKDTIDTYDLCYYIGHETMAVCRPRSQKAWLWQRLSN